MASKVLHQPKMRTAFDQFQIHTLIQLNFLHLILHVKVSLCRKSIYYLRLKPMDLCLCSLVEVGGLEAWISDGSCDDINNNALCQFDGGDCCGANVRKQHCMDCQCLGNTVFGTFSYFYIYTFSTRNLTQDFF